MTREELLGKSKEELADLVASLLQKNRERQDQVELLKRKMNLMVLRTMDSLPEIEDDRY